MLALSLQLSMSMAVAAHVPACPRFPAWQLKHGKAYGSVEVGPVYVCMTDHRSLWATPATVYSPACCYVHR